MASIEMSYFKAEVVDYLIKIEELCRKRNVPMSRVTLIMRDPSNDEMCVLLTTEKGSDNVREAVEIALGHGEI